MTECCATYCFKAIDADGKAQIQELFSRIQKAQIHYQKYAIQSQWGCGWLGYILQEFIPNVNLDKAREYLDFDGKIVWLSDTLASDDQFTLDIISRYIPTNIVWSIILKKCNYNKISLCYMACNESENIFINTDRTGTIFPWKYSLYVHFPWYRACTNDDGTVVYKTEEVFTGDFTVSDEALLKLNEIIQIVAATLTKVPDKYSEPDEEALKALMPQRTVKSAFTVLSNVLYSMDDFGCSLNRFTSTITQDNKNTEQVLKSNIFGG